MKFIITKAEYDALDDTQKAFYEAKGDDYQFTVEGLPDVSGMQAKMQELLDERKRDQQARKEADEKAKKDADAAARARGDIEALDKSWGEKLAAEQAAHAATRQRYLGQVQDLTVNKTAQELATKLFGEGAGPLLHNVSSRLELEEAESGDLKVRVKGRDGTKSAVTLEELEKEFRNDKAFAPFLVQTRATGPSGATDKGTGPSSISSKDNGMSEEERLRLFKENPQEFSRQFGVRTN